MVVEATLLSNELTRFGTYIGWKSNGKPSILDLVKAGFYYTGHSDLVRCFSCGIEIKDWQQNSDPLLVHSSGSPGCTAVSGSGDNDRQDTAPSFSEPNQSSTRMEAPLTSCAAWSNSGISRNETAGHITMGVNSLCFRGPWSKISSANRTFSSNQSEGDSHTTSQNSTLDTLQTRENQTTCGSIPMETSSRTQIHRRRSDGAERSLKKDRKTIANRHNSSPDANPTVFQTSEEARFQTYIRWTSISVARAKEFAHAGFIYLGPADRVQCVFCHGMLHLWKSEDSPVGEHCKHFPQCKYVVEYLSTVQPAVPKHTKYRTEASRLGSFQDWPPLKNPKPTALAKAGFFYTGRKDCVRCFCCNGGLCQWDASDDPWVEHARWFPNCSYVKQTKGPAFIYSVLGCTKFTKTETASVATTPNWQMNKQNSRKTTGDKMTTDMDSPIIKAVLRLDIPKKFVKKAIRQRLTENGQDFTSETALLEAVFGISQKSGEDFRTTKKLKMPTNGAGASSTSKNFLLLAEENQKLKEQKMCKICLDDDACVAFIPCGHLVCCSSCAPALALCPICRAKITGTVRTYMS